MKRTFYIACLLLAFGLTAAATGNGQKIKALIVTGQDGNHWWQGGSDAIKLMMENSGLFTVDIAVTPDWNEDMAAFHPNFSQYNVVVINYGGNTWAEPARKSFEQYVAQGGGVVIIHSSIVPMDDWPAYNEMMGMGAWNGRNEKCGPYVYWKNGRVIYDYSPGGAGHHGLQHPFTVTHRAPDHPILRDLPEVWDHVKDELYARPRGPAKNLQLLATTFDKTLPDDPDRQEPILWTVNWGKGRIFVDLMGHAGNDPELRYAMTCTGFQVTLLRGCEWAATGEVTQAVPKDFPSEGVITLRREFKEN